MLNNMKIRNTTICDCGREFIIKDIQKLQRIDDKSFYSGVVKHYSKAICPNCGKEVILLLKQAGQTYKVLNVAEYEKTTTQELTTTENETGVVETENEVVKTGTNELICPVCEKECKSKSGMLAHMRTHENN